MTSKSANPTPTEVASGLGLREVNTDRVIDLIAVDTLLLMHRAPNTTPKMKQRIEKVWKEWHPGGTWEDDAEPITSVMLMGPPGHGKTTSYREACKKVARALNMEYLEGEKLAAVDVIDPEKHFVFVVQDTAGVVSALEWLGLPTKEKMKIIEASEQGGKDVYAMGRLFAPEMIKVMAASGACVLLDDLPNAQPGIQNVALSLTETHSYNSLRLPHAYIGATGNLGATDGTSTNRVSSALINRMRVLFIQDKLPSFIQRGTERYHDQIGDAAVLSFLNRHDECFTEWPDAAKPRPHATPRSWDKFIVYARRSVRKAGSLAAAMVDLPTEASALLGPAVASKYESYMNAYIKSADPIARDIIMKGEYDKKTMEKRTAEGLSGSGQSFFYQLGMALSDYAAKKVLLDGGKTEVAMTRLVEGLMLIQDQSSMNQALDNFKRVLAIKAEHLSNPSSEKSRELKQDVKQQFLDILVKHPECSAEVRSSLIRVMSNSAQYESAHARRQRRTGNAPK